VFEVFRSVRTVGFSVYPNLKVAEKLMLFSFKEIPPYVGMTIRNDWNLVLGIWNFKIPNFPNFTKKEL
jgi:hypothetical protein